MKRVFEAPTVYATIITCFAEAAWKSAAFAHSHQRKQ